MDAAERDTTLRAALDLFDAGRYLAAHELLEELWEATEGPEADFFKGLLQAAVALHHHECGNLEGAAMLYTGHRRCLSAYQPEHAGIQVTRFLAEMQAFLRPAIEGRERSTAVERPRLRRAD